MTGDDDLVEIGWTVAVDEDHRDVVLSFDTPLGPFTHAMPAAAALELGRALIEAGVDADPDLDQPDYRQILS